MYDEYNELDELLEDAYLEGYYNGYEDDYYTEKRGLDKEFIKAYDKFYGQDPQDTGDEFDNYNNFMKLGGKHWSTSGNELIRLGLTGNHGLKPEKWDEDNREAAKYVKDFKKLYSRSGNDGNHIPLSQMTPEERAEFKKGLEDKKAAKIKAKEDAEKLIDQLHKDTNRRNKYIKDAKEQQDIMSNHQNKIRDKALKEKIANYKKSNKISNINAGLGAAAIGATVGGIGYGLYKHNQNKKEMLNALRDPKFRDTHPELVKKYRKELIKAGIKLESGYQDDINDYYIEKTIYKIKKPTANQKLTKKFKNEEDILKFYEQLYRKNLSMSDKYIALKTAYQNLDRDTSDPLLKKYYGDQRSKYFWVYPKFIGDGRTSYVPPEDPLHEDPEVLKKFTSKKSARQKHIAMGVGAVGGTALTVGGLALHDKYKKKKEEERKIIELLKNPVLRKKHPELVKKYRKELIKAGIKLESYNDYLY